MTWRADELLVGVVGAGAMGQGIIQVAVSNGIKTIIHDSRPEAAVEALAQVSGRLDRLVAKGQLDQASADEAKARMILAQELDDFAHCDVVIEAIIEDLEVKRTLFQKLESVVGEDCILCSNTSSIPIASIASACKRPRNVAGLHFFNPVPLMKLVEVISASDTDPEVAQYLHDLGQRLGRTPVMVKDAPGFLVNMGGGAYSTEAFAIFHERVASPAQIDAIMRDCHGFRMGPFALSDLTGIDVNYPVRQIIYAGYQHDPRLAHHIGS